MLPCATGFLPMWRPRCALLALCATVCASQIHTISPDVFLAPAFHGAGDGRGDADAAANATTASANVTLYDAPAGASVIDSSGDVPTLVRDAAPARVAVPIGAMPMCLAYNIPNATSSLGVSRADMARLLGIDRAARGRAGVALRSFNGAVAVPNAAALRLVGAAASTRGVARLAVSVLSLVAGGEAAPVTAAPAPDIAVEDEALVAATVAASPMSFGLAPLVSATRARVPCAALHVVEKYGSREEWRFVAPQMPVAVSASLEARSTGVAVKDVKLMYPLLAPVFATIHAAAGPECTGPPAGQAAKVIGVLGSPSLRDHLGRWGVLLRSETALADAGNTLVALGCGPPPVARVGGSSVVFTLVADLALQSSAVENLWVRYLPRGSGFGSSEVASGAMRWGASDAPFTHSILEAAPRLRNVPLTGFAVALPFNLGSGVVQLTIPLCLVRDLFTGAIASWDDGRLADANPFVVLPPIPVVPVVRGDSSGTTFVFTEGLSRLAGLCPGSATLSPSKLWADGQASTAVVAVNGSRGVVKAILQTVGAVGYVGLPAVRLSGVPAARILHPDGVTVTTDGDAVSGALAAAEVDGHNRLTFGVRATAYPFTGVTYALFNTELTGNCEAAGRSLSWLAKAIAGQAERAVHVALHYTPMPADLTARSLSVLQTATCDGKLLLVPPPAAPSRLIWPFVLGGSLLLVAIVVPAAAHAITRLLAHRRLRFCPQDPQRPFAAFFVTVANETLLRDELAPMVQSKLLRQLERQVTVMAERHGCYVARRLEAHFLLVSRSAEAAVRCAVAIVGSEPPAHHVEERSESRRMSAPVEVIPTASMPTASMFPASPTSARAVSTKRSEPSDSRSPLASSHVGTRTSTAHTIPATTRRRDAFALRLVAGVAFGFGRILPPSDAAPAFGYAGSPVDDAAAAADGTARLSGGRIGCSAGLHDAIVEDADVGFLRSLDYEFEEVEDGGSIGVPHLLVCTQQAAALCLGASSTANSSRRRTLCDDTLGGAGLLTAALQQSESGVTTRRVAAVVVRVPVDVTGQQVPLSDIADLARAAVRAADEHHGVVHEVSSSGAALLLNASRRTAQPLHRALAAARMLTEEAAGIFGAPCFGGVGYAVATVGQVAGTTVGGGVPLERARLLAQAAERLGAAVPAEPKHWVESAPGQAVPQLDGGETPMALLDGPPNRPSPPHADSDSHTAAPPVDTQVLFCGTHAEDVGTAFFFEPVDIGVWPTDALGTRSVPFALNALRGAKLQAGNEEARDEWMYILDAQSGSVSPSIGDLTSQTTTANASALSLAVDAVKVLLSGSPCPELIPAAVPGLSAAQMALQRHNNNVLSAAKDRMSDLCRLFGRVKTKEN